MNDTNKTILSYRKNIEQRLKKLYRKELLLASASSFFKFLGIYGGTLLLLQIAEILFRFNSEIRTIIFFLFIAFLLLTFFYLFFRDVALKYKIFKGIDYYRLAEKAGKKFPEIKDELKNALQILDSGQAGVSTDLIEAAFKKVYKKSEHLDFSRAYEIQISFKEFIFQALFVFQVLLTFFVPAFKAALTRLDQYDKEFIEPPKFSFVVTPGNKTITKGDDLSVTVKIKGEQKDEITLKKKSEEDYDFVGFKLRKDSAGVFKKNFYAVATSFKYFVTAEGVNSDTFFVKVINRPLITSLSLVAIPPAYTGLPQAVQKDNGNYSGLPGTILKLTITSSKQLDSALILLDNGTIIPMSVSNNKADGRLRILKPFSYHFRLVDKYGITNIKPIEYSVKTETDAYPVIEVIKPPKDVKLGSENILPFIIDISDDFGFTSLKLYYRLSQSQFGKVEKNFKFVNIPFERGKKEEEVFYNWNLFPLSLTENDVVSYYLEIKDNDNVNGPKAAKTGLRMVRVPSLNELFNEAENTQKLSEDELKKTYNEAEKLKQDIDKIANELKQNKKKIDWEEKQKIENAFKRFQQLKKKAEKISKQLEKARKELAKHKLLSKETLKKYLELQKLLDEMTSQDLKKAFEKMQQMLKSLMRDKAQMSLQNLKFNEEAFKKSLERTINLLKRIHIEQKMDELLKRADKLSKDQKDISEKIKKGEKLSPQEKEAMRKKQAAIKKDLQKLEKEMKKLAKEMKDLKDMPAKEMEKVAKDFKNQQNEKLSDKAESQMTAGDFQQASKTQMQIEQNIAKTKKQLSQIQSSIRMKNQMEVMAKMLSTINNLLELSKEQEALKNSTQNLSPQSPALREKARQQNNLSEDLNRIISQMSSLSQKTFAITPEMGRAIGSAQAKMNAATMALQDRNSSLAVIDQRGAMKYLNETAKLMQSALSGMMKPGSGGGMMSLMQQLQKLTGQQMNLNQLTKMLKQGGMSQQQLAQLQRLVRQQKLIQKSLEELNREFKQSGESKKLTGNLDKIIQEMKEVVSNLSSQNIDDNLIHKQERILSRLLDAQRSINERDYEKRRESQAGKQFPAQSPPELILQTEEGRNKIRDALIKALREGYSKDYEDLIRKYFEQLEKNPPADSLR